MFVTLRHGRNDNFIANPHSATVNFLGFVRRKVSANVYDPVISNAEEPVKVIENRLELTSEDGLVMELDEANPLDHAAKRLCPEENGQGYVVVEKKILDPSTPDSQLHLIKKILEADRRKLYEKTLLGVVSVMKTPGKSRRISSPSSSPKSPTSRPSSTNMRPLDSSTLSKDQHDKSVNPIEERFYYVPLLIDVKTCLPDYVVHRAEDRHLNVSARPKISKGSKSSGGSNGRLTPSPRSRRRSGGLGNDQTKGTSKLPAQLEQLSVSKPN